LICADVGVLGNGGVIDGGAIPNFVRQYDYNNDQLLPITWSGMHGCNGECRPRLVEFDSCINVVVDDVTLQNSPDWTSHYLNCTNVRISNVTVFGDHRWPNNDGIDPDSSINVTISNCYVSTGDDAVCPKTSEGFGPLRNLLVIDSQLSSRSSAFKVETSVILEV
jgi:polygalacturonase